MSTIAATAMVFTLDEERNLARCLASLTRFEDVIVVDSGSTDRTVAIASAHGARVVTHPFTGFGAQRTWALAHAGARHPWVLVLDADERVPEALAAEIERVLACPAPRIGAYRLRRRFHLRGRWVPRASLYPSWVVRLVHKDRVRFVDRGHAETQEVDGEIGALEHDLHDEDRKGIEAWLVRHARYAVREAEHELRASGRIGDVLALDPLRRREALKAIARRLPLRGLAYFVYAYVVRGGILEGSRGLELSVRRAVYQEMIAIARRALLAERDEAR
jgi:glycosyltransferase involved in cell wall biosynthesis